MMLASAMRSAAPRGFNAALQLAARRGPAVAPSTAPTLLAAPLRHTAAPLHRTLPRQYTAAVRWPSTPKPNPTPWQWRRTPSWWSRQSPFPHQASRAAMAGLASVPLGVVPRGGGFALGEVDDTATPTTTLSPEQRALLPTATDDFIEMREQGLLFVDKSGFISELVRDSTKASLITRHRRSGKTTAMRMAACFLDQRYMGQSAKWFEGLEVMNDPEAVKHMGKYPVIFLDLKSAGAASYGAFLKNLARQVYLVYQTFPELELLKGKEKLEYDNMMSNLQKIRDDAEPFDENRIKAWESPVGNSLAVLTRLIATAPEGQKPWILIDEYDAPVDQAFSAKAGRFHGQVIEFMKRFLGDALKGNPHLHKAVMTGIDKNPVLSGTDGVNNAKVRSVLSTHYAQYFGFLEHQVQWLLSRFDHTTCMSEVRKWYNGYNIGGYMLYNPVSIIDYIDNGFKVNTYWVGTGQREESILVSRLQSLSPEDGISILQTLIQMTSFDSAGIDTKAMRANFMTGLIYDGDTMPDDIWRLMLNQGYLTCRDDKLYIPNYEVLQSIKLMVSRWLQPQFGIDTKRLSSVTQLLVENKVEQFCDALKSFLIRVPTGYEISVNEPEKFYHACVLFFMADLERYYIIKSNPQVGEGRPDILLIPRITESGSVIDHSRPAIVMEFKRETSKGFSVLLRRIREALGQIQEKDYTASFLEHDVQRVVNIGMVFRARQMEFGIERFALDSVRGAYVPERPELVVDATSRVVGEYTARLERERGNVESHSRE